MQNLLLVIADNSPRTRANHKYLWAELRRANLKRFPYHFLFRVVGDCVRILVVRHHRRHPEYGVERE